MKKLLSLITGLLFIGVLNAQQTVSLTLQVDVSQVPSVDAAGISVGGTFNGFSPEPMNDQGNDVWSLTVDVPANSTVLWKYINGTDFGNNTSIENVPSECGQDDGFGGNNRILEIESSDITLPVVCYSSCSECTDPNPSFDLTLQVDVSELDSVSSEGIHVGGTFNSFSPQLMNDQGNGIWSVTVSVEEGSTVLWKYINGDSFADQVESVPSDCGQADGFGGFNRDLVMPGADTTAGPVCFSSCQACDQQPNEFTLTLLVDASQLDSINSNGGIHVAGTFNGFNPAAMTDEGNGIYSFSASVSEGSNVLYKFLNSPDFSQAEQVPSDCGEPDGFGGFNRSLSMPSADTTAGPVCFGACVACDEVPEEFILTLLVDASQLDSINSNGGIHVAGSFNGFNPAPMNDDGNGLFSFSTAVTEGSTVVYKFLNSPDFTAAEEVPEECGESDGFGGFNRILTMPSADTTAGPVCFSSCEECPSDVPCEAPYPKVDGLSFSNENGGVLLSWNPILGSIGCQLQVGTTAANAQTVTVFGENASSFFVPGNAIQAGLTYSWRVRCGCSTNPLIVGPYSNISTFVFLDFGISQEPQTTLGAAPNPSNGQTFVTLNSAREADQGLIEVYDMSGRLVKELYSGSIPAEEMRFEFNGSHLPEGIYLIRFTTNNEVKTEKFMISR